MDITCIPMAHGFIHLAAVVDWFTRRVPAWRVSITLANAFRIEAVEEALARHGAPENFNSDQGSQSTSTDFVKVGASPGRSGTRDPCGEVQSTRVKSKWPVRISRTALPDWA